jgi:hypothetical protein
MICFWWLGRVLGKAPFTTISVGGYFVFNYWGVTNFTRFCFYLYGTPRLHWLKWSLALGCWKVCMCWQGFYPFYLTMASSKGFNTLLILHSPNTNSPCSNSLVDFQLNSNLKFFVNFLRLTFLDMFYLSTSGPFNMVFKHFWNSFDLEDSTNSFIQLH